MITNQSNLVDHNCCVWRVCSDDVWAIRTCHDCSYSARTIRTLTGHLLWPLAIESQFGYLVCRGLPLLASIFLHLEYLLPQLRREAAILLQQRQEDSSCAFLALIRAHLRRSVLVRVCSCHSNDMLFSSLVLHLFQLEASFTKKHASTILNVNSLANKFKDKLYWNWVDKSSYQVNFRLLEELRQRLCKSLLWLLSMTSL